MVKTLPAKRAASTLEVNAIELLDFGNQRDSVKFSLCFPKSCPAQARKIRSK